METNIENETNLDTKSYTNVATGPSTDILVDTDMSSKYYMPEKDLCHVYRPMRCYFLQEEHYLQELTIGEYVMIPVKRPRTRNIKFLDLIL